MFAETEEKLLIQQAYVQRVEGVSKRATPGQQFDIEVEAAERLGGPASQSQGWHMQYAIYHGSTPEEFVNLDMVSFDHAGNAEYWDGKWKFSVDTPSEPGDYFLKMSLYCGYEDRHCGQQGFSMMPLYQQDVGVDFTVVSSGHASSPEAVSFELELPYYCEDSDGGKDYRTQGTVVTRGSKALGGDEPLHDRCDGNTLHEKYCSGTYPAYEEFFCPNGCLNGKCVTQRTGKPTINRVWAEKDLYNCVGQSSSCSSVDIYIEVLKSDGQRPSSGDDSGGLVSVTWASWYSGREAYDDDPGNLATRSTPADPNRVYYSMGYSEDNTRMPSTHRFLLEAREGTETVKKEYMLVFESPDSIYVEELERTEYFTDVGSSGALSDAVHDLADLKIIHGNPDGSFQPDRAINRAEVAKMIMLAKEFDDSWSISGTGLSDVVSSEWYAPYVFAAVAEGIIFGYPDSTFKPANTINTAELLAMLSRAFGLEQGLHQTYKDVPANAWYAQYAGIAQKYQLFPDRTSYLSPSSLLTRGDVAIALSRYLAATR